MAKAVKEATELRKQTEDKIALQRVQVAVDLEKRKAEEERREALREQEALLNKKFHSELVETVEAAKARAVRETMELIKPQLQKQEAVEAAIRAAEERARDRERSMAAQVSWCAAWLAGLVGLRAAFGMACLKESFLRETLQRGST